jgi:hypothetical protein
MKKCLLYLFLTCCFQLSIAQTLTVGDVIINEFAADNDPNANDFVEILILKDSADLRGLRITDNEIVAGVLNNGESVFVFGNDAFLNNIPRGTLLVVYTIAAGVTTDTDPAGDFKMILAPGTGFISDVDGLGGSSNAGFSTAGEAIYLYLPGADGNSAGTDNVYLDFVSWEADVADAPAGLIDINLPADADNGYFTGNTAAGNDDVANWVKSGALGAETIGTPNPTQDLSGIRVVTGPITPSVNLSVSATTTREAATPATLTLTATANVAVTTAQTVNVAITGLAAADFTLSGTTITIAAGQTTGTVTLTIADDAVLEGTEIGTATISTPSTGITLGTATTRDFVVFDNDFPAAPVANNELTLSLVSSFSNRNTLTRSSSEITTYDATSKRLFVVNSLGGTGSSPVVSAPKLDIYNFANPRTPVLITSIDMLQFGGGINSVAVRNGIVALAIEDVIPQNNGKVVFLNTEGVFQNQVTAGALPDMITFTPDGKFVLTANEGEPSGDYTNDPEGSITIVDIQGGIAALTQSNVVTVGFQSFDGTEDAMRAAGVRIYGVNTATGGFAPTSKDLEPEYITVSADSKTAYVTLQENNALATVNLETKLITKVTPLGYKNHNLLTNGLDASDQAGPVSIANFPVYGMYQPDAIASYAVNNITYLVTANEGDAREYDDNANPAFQLAEEARINAVTLDPVRFPKGNLLKDNNVLGRLNVTTKLGDVDGDGDLDSLFAYGARSFTIWNGATGARIFDSGDQLERITAADATFGTVFNADNGNGTPSRRNRSDNKGPEPEGVTVATIGGKNYAFIALERIGGVMVYNVTNPQTPTFVQYINNRNVTTGGGNLGPEGIFYIPAADSPIDTALIVVSNEISSTIATYKIAQDVNCAKFAPAKPSITANGSAFTATFTLNSSIATGNQWLKDGVAIAGATAQTLAITAGGVYTVRVSSGVCSTTSDPFTVTATESSFNAENLKLYPNPTNDNISVVYAPAYAAKAVKASVYNTLGLKIGEKSLQESEGVWKTNFNVSNFNEGRYIIRIEDSKQTSVKSFIKQ